MKYINIKQEEQQRYSTLMDECQVFWAFSNDQFDKNKTPLKEGDKYVSIGAGGFMPKGNAEKFAKGMIAIEKWTRQAKKDAKEVILYELNNYECFYTGDITDALPRLTELGYTKAQVQKVYNANKHLVEV